MSRNMRRRISWDFGNLIPYVPTILDFLHLLYQLKIIRKPEKNLFNHIYFLMISRNLGGNTSIISTISEAAGQGFSLSFREYSLISSPHPSNCFCHCKYSKEIPIYKYLLQTASL